MNLFVLDKDPTLAAQAHYDRHVGKMLLEACQIMSTAQWELDDGSFGNFNNIYLPTHENHPCARWVRECTGNYLWALELAYALAEEYRLRFDKQHGSAETLLYLDAVPRRLDRSPRRSFAVAVTGSTPVTEPHSHDIVGYNYELKGFGADDDGIVAMYRHYYETRKAHLREYTNRVAPIWLPLGDGSKVEYKA